MNGLFEKYKIISNSVINEGWSGDSKTLLVNEVGEKFLLRESPLSLQEKREKQFSYLKQIYSVGVDMPRPFECGIAGDKFYTLLEYLEGDNAERVVKNYSNEQAYKLGLQAGNILNKIHSVKVCHSFTPWEELYANKANRKIEKFEKCEIDLPKKQFIVNLYKENLGLAKQRPSYYCHGDYHLGNMIVHNGKLRIVDFDKCAVADPVDDFKPFCWNVFINEYFETGLINGYFNCEIPKGFFELLRFYALEVCVSQMPWAVTFGKDEIETAQKVYNCILKWYNDFNSVVPSWYKGVSHFN